MVPQRPQSLWFPPDVPAWPSSGSTPAVDLAAHLARFRSVDAAQAMSAAPRWQFSTLRHRPSSRRCRGGGVPAVALPPERSSSDLDSFLAEAEESVRAKRKTVSGTAPPAGADSWVRVRGSRVRQPQLL